MADTLPEHYTTEFSTNWIHRTQQMVGRLDRFVDEDSYTGERKRYDRISAKQSRVRTERKGATNITETGLDNRWAYHVNYDIGDLLDKDDSKKLGELVLPTSPYVRNHAFAHMRDCDDVTWAAAIDDAKKGELGTEPSPLPGTQTIAHGSVGLTLAKLIEAREILQDAELEDESPLVLCVTKKQLTDLLNETKIQSSDYNTIRALVAGEVNSFMGFEFVKIARLPLSGTTRTCPGWFKGAIKRIKGNMSADISIRNDLSNSTQIYSDWDLGAVRIYDEGVININCTEA